MLTHQKYSVNTILWSSSLVKNKSPKIHSIVGTHLSVDFILTFRQAESSFRLIFHNMAIQKRVKSVCTVNDSHRQECLSAEFASNDNDFVCVYDELVKALSHVGCGWA